MTAQPNVDQSIQKVRDALRAKGMRWTPQRRSLLEMLFESDGHITGADLVERARLRDPETIASTVYRTLGALEELGVVVHSHAADGREEFHVLPLAEHAHLTCQACGRSWELEPREVQGLEQVLADRRGFDVDVSHLTVAGRCSDCIAGQ